MREATGPHAPFLWKVRGVRLRADLVAVVLEHKVYLYAFSDLALVSSVETVVNPLGLAALSSSGPPLLAAPGLHRGALRLEKLGGARRETRFVAAHDSGLAALALTPNGSRVATAGDRGTLVRVFDTASGGLVAELRRGADPACIRALALSPCGAWVVAA